MEILASVVLLAGCAAASPHATIAPEPDASEQPTTMMSERLFFGRIIPSGGIVSDSAWAIFLAEVVTPRFPLD
jgi:hypothetical protein